MEKKIKENDEILRWVKVFHTNGLNINPLKRVIRKRLFVILVIISIHSITNI